MTLSLGWLWNKKKKKKKKRKVRRVTLCAVTLTTAVKHEDD